MLQTIKGKYKEGCVELTELPEQVAEAEVLVTFLPQEKVPDGPTLVSPRPAALYGIWRDKIPPDFDVEAALQEIRSQSQSEWEL